MCNIAVLLANCGVVCSNFGDSLFAGVDYAMLMAVKDGHMKAVTEKVVNGMMNAWVRGPGLTIVGYSMFVL